MTRENRYKEALENIANPIAHMQKEARKAKEKLDGGMAVALSSDPNYLKSIAKKALDESEA